MKTDYYLKKILLVLLVGTLLAASLTACSFVLPDPPEPGPLPDPDPDPEPDPEPEWREDPYLILVNAHNPLSEDVEPDLKTVQGQFKMEVTAANALIEMIAAAKEEGISLLLCSAYRPYSTQERLYKNQVQKYINQGYAEADAGEKAATVVARPGTSEHNTGLAADIVTPSHQTLDPAFANTGAAKWMATNGHKYGFILRYPEDKQDITGIIFEPWHFRYVGLEHAQNIFESEQCLEEYLGEV